MSTDPPDRCHLVCDDTGQPVASYRGQPLDEQGRAAMLNLVTAAQRMWDDMPAEERAEIEARQAAARERNRARLARAQGQEEGTR